MQVDLNADVGEGAGHDSELMEIISSANVACGWHAGDAGMMRDTVALALSRGVAIGAHPSYPDRDNFGRREMKLPAADVHAHVLYQVGALVAIARAQGARLAHVKPHGALYNQAAADAQLADAVAQAVRDIDPSLAIYGIAGGALIDAARRAGLRAVAEVFADREYQADGTLVPRTHKAAVIEDLERVPARTLLMVREGVVTSVDGRLVPLAAQSICLHGDAAHALAFARAIKITLSAAGIEVRAPAAC